MFQYLIRKIDLIISVVLLDQALVCRFIFVKQINCQYVEYSTVLQNKQTNSKRYNYQMCATNLVLVFTQITVSNK